MSRALGQLGLRRLLGQLRLRRPLGQLGLGRRQLRRLRLRLPQDRQGLLRVGVQFGTVDNFDPHPTVGGNGDGLRQIEVFSRLLDFNTSDRMNVVNGLAESVEPNETADEWVVTLTPRR